MKDIFLVSYFVELKLIVEIIFHSTDVILTIALDLSLRHNQIH